MAKEMLISKEDGHECRIAVLSDGLLEELYVERDSTASRVGNIYKAKVTNVESSIQAAFLDFGMGKNGFLHITDIHPQYFPKGQQGSEAIGRKRPHRQRPPIQECLRRGQEVVVQMTKEGIGTKGPTMTTYLSIPGRMLVMLPGMSQSGISRKIEDEQLRAKARANLSELKLPSDKGFIVRTVGAAHNKRELQRDLNYLLRLWESVTQRTKTVKAPAAIYQESDLITRTLRDVYNTDIDRIVCDSEAVAVKVREFLAVAMPRTKNPIELYAGKDGLFHDSGLEDEIEKTYSRTVAMPSGGSLVIDQTEALVAVDVNSGRYRKHSNAETTALKINLEAAGEIARQLRLRDLGGVVVMDFIDMRDMKDRRAVEKALREAIKPDRAKTKILRMSNFGIIEMTRQRLKPSLKSSIYVPCDHCDGTGLIKSPESLAMLVMRDIHRACANDEVARVEVSLHPRVANQLTNRHRQQISELEKQSGKRIIIRSQPDLGATEVRLVCRNDRGGEVPTEPPKAGTARQKRLQTVPLEEAAKAGKKDQEQPQEAKKASKRRRSRGKGSGRKTAKKTGEDAQKKTSEPQDEKPPAEKKSRAKAHSKKAAPTENSGREGSASDEEPREEKPAPRKRSRRRGGRKHRSRKAEKPAGEQAESTGEQVKENS